MNLPLVDLVIIIIYLVGMIVLGLYASRKMRSTSAGYYLAGRTLRWPIIGAALFASNISTIHLIGLAASGYNEGFAWGNYETMAVITLIILGLVFAPFYFRTKIATLPEFLEKRYNSTARTFLAFMGIMGALLVHIGLSLFAGATILELFFGLDTITSIVIITVITAIYTIVGGLKAVVVTETIQTVFLIVGAFIVTGYAIAALPDFGIHSYADLKAAAKPDQLSLVETDNSNGLAWYAVLLGYPVIGIWYWCTDQTIVQRVLGAEAEYDAKTGPLFAALLKFLPLLIIIFPGVIAYVIFSDKIGDQANLALPILIQELIPSGLKGLISAGILAALMSTIAAALHSSATLVSLDLFKGLKEKFGEKRQIMVGRISALVVMLLAMLWSTQGDKFSSIFEANAIIVGSIAPAITTVFVFGIFWRRGTAEAAVVTFITGIIIGTLAVMSDIPVWGDKRFITEILAIGPLLLPWYGFLICSGVYIVVSYLTPKPDPEVVNPLTWSKPWEMLSGKIESWKDPRVLSIGLMLLFVALYIWFW